MMLPKEKKIMKGKKRYTVGVLVGGILDEFTKTVCMGAMRAAEKEDVNID